MNEITASLITTSDVTYFAGDDLFDLQEMLADDFDGAITFAKTEVPNVMLALAADVPVAIVRFA